MPRSCDHMKILVTGGAGFVGSHTVDMLLKEGCEVVVLDNLDPQVHGEVVGPPPNLLAHVEKDGFRFVRGDVRDSAALSAALSGVDRVLHLAAAVGVGQSMYEPFHYCSVNVGGTAQLLDILAKEKTAVRKVVVASSMTQQIIPVSPGVRRDRDGTQRRRKKKTTENGS